MDVVICGAGEVGQHAARELARGNNITMIDQSEPKLEVLDEVLDVRNLLGNCTDAAVLKEAGVPSADLFVAVTNVDEVNLLSASIANGLGAERTVARVHHSAYFDGRAMDYGLHLGIDHLVCPDYATAQEIGQVLRSPGALAVEQFAHGQVEIQQLPVSPDAPAIGKSLMELHLPRSSRIAALERAGHTFIPEARTVIGRGDIVTIIGESDTFDRARKLIHTEPSRRKRIVIMGGSPLAVWLCRELKSKRFSVRLFEANRDRAEELAEKLEWVTVINADVTAPDTMDEEQVGDADAFVAATADDEHNILATARAKKMGVDQAIVVLNRSTYMHMVMDVGIDKAFSPRITAVEGIRRMLETGPIRHLTTLAVGIADVYEIRVGDHGNGVTGKALKDVKMPGGSIIAAIQREDKVRVPGAMDTINTGDTLILIGPGGLEKQLRKAFGL